MTAVGVVRTRLLAISAVTAIVGQRVYALILPENATFPAIRVQRISQLEPMHFRGPVSMFSARVQVDAIAATKAAADALDAAVLGNGLGSVATGLKGWTGDLSATHVHAIRAIDVREMYDPEELRQFRISRDFSVEFEGTS